MSLDAPLVDYAGDRIEAQMIDLAGVGAVLIEGTYTTLLANVHLHVFLDRTVDDTRASRIERAREPQDAFIERVLHIEHGIIRPHRSLADILITKDFRVIEGIPAEHVNEESNA